MYIETSSPRVPGDIAQLISPQFIPDGHQRYVPWCTQQSRLLLRHLQTSAMKPGLYVDSRKLRIVCMLSAATVTYLNRRVLSNATLVTPSPPCLLLPLRNPQSLSSGYVSQTPLANPVTNLTPRPFVPVFYCDSHYTSCHVSSYKPV